MYLQKTKRIVLESSILEIDINVTEQLQSLLSNEKVSSIAFQSVLVSAIQIFQRVQEDETALSNAAISLAQRQQIKEMLDSVELMTETLKTALNAQGTRILDLQPNNLSSSTEKKTWWICVESTIKTLTAGNEWINSIVAGQDEENPTRILASIVSSFLKDHHSTLHSEVQC